MGSRLSVGGAQPTTEAILGCEASDRETARGLLANQGCRGRDRGSRPSHPGARGERTIGAVGIRSEADDENPGASVADAWNWPRTADLIPVGATPSFADLRAVLP